MLRGRMAIETVPHLFFKQAKARPDAPAYYVKANGRWTPTSWAGYAGEVKSAARTLIALGLGPGDTVCILGFNRPEWVVMDLATMTIGGAPAGIYTTCSPSEVQYIVHHAESKVVLVENAHQWQKIEKELDRLPHLRHVVLMKGAPAIEHPLVLSWEAFLEKGEGVDEARVDERLAALEPGGLATLIYTSGTTGPPKGVMLSHENLAWTAGLGIRMNKVTPADVALSYLPLSHIAEQTLTIHGACSAGVTVYFAESLDKLADNLKEVEPTVFFGVPRIWEKFYAGIQQKLAVAPPAKKRIADTARKIGLRYNLAKNEGKTPNLLLEQAHKAADKLVFSKLKAAIGFRRARVCISGAAPIAPEVLEFFTSLDIRIQEVYGQSEGTGPTSYNVDGKTRLGSVGPPLPGVAVMIADDGEILLKGPNVFLGYYKEPAATAEALVHGGLHSGDLGKIDEDGYLWITGRKKEIIITAGGKNIAPKNIEGALKSHPLISEAVVIGDRRKYLTALITLDPEAAARFMQERGLQGAPHESPAVRAQLQDAVDEVNRELAQVETVKKFHILSRPFGVDTGELTPTLKIKRAVVYRHFAVEIEAMYAE
jgi:long-chain acyl-CoA synthetase